MPAQCGSISLICSGPILRDRQAVGEAALEQVVEQRQFPLFGGDDDLAADIVRDAVLLAELAITRRLRWRTSP